LKKTDKIELKKWFETAEQRKIITGSGFSALNLSEQKDIVYPQSFKRIGTDNFAVIKLKSSDALAVFGKGNHGFKGMNFKHNNISALVCQLNHVNAVNLRKKFPFTSPSPLAAYDITVGLGDRLGVASQGHLRLLKSSTVCPVLAQQSVRELNLTGRTYEEVLDSASWAVFKEGYEKPWGADGDHLKTADWVVKALKIGFSMITADVSDFIHNEFANMTEAGLLPHYMKLEKKYVRRIESEYLDKPFRLDSGDEIRFTKKDLMLSALIYKDAVDHALKLYGAGIKVRKFFDFELSIDETTTPTSYQAHIFVAMETIEKGVRITSVAPRFIGEFQKGIDYIGDVGEFEKTFRIHASIARYLGYKISVHSGSDKFMIFPLVGKYAKKYHLKTAGTNWLQALEVIALKDRDLFKRIYAKAVESYPVARQYYHITPNLENVPDIGTVDEKEYPDLFKNPDVRQVLHITYGELFKSSELKEGIFRTLDAYLEDYHLSLNLHISRHFNLLGIKGI
jgi:tagaturonate epimerase